MIKVLRDAINDCLFTMDKLVIDTVDNVGVPMTECFPNECGNIITINGVEYELTVTVELKKKIVHREVWCVEYYSYNTWCGMSYPCLFFDTEELAREYISKYKSGCTGRVFTKNIKADTLEELNKKIHFDTDRKYHR